MKGKGKGKDMGNSSKDSSLQLPDLMPGEIEMLTKCKSLLENVNNREDIGINDMENLQFKLEEILVSILNKRDSMEAEIRSVPTSKEKKSKQAKEPPTKKGRFVDSKPTKKTKESTKASHSSGTVGRPKSQSSRSQEPEFPNSSILNLKLQRNEAPNRFWDFLKPYTADITQDYIKFLEEWAKPISEDDDCYKIPALGKHFSHEWSNRNVQDEQREGAKANDKRKSGSSNSTLNSTDTERILKRARRDSAPEEPCPFGPLTQRLASCLINQNIMTSMEDTIDNVKDDTSEEPSNSVIIKSLNIGNTQDVEKKIRKRLEIAGILEHDRTEDNEDSQDEVLAELQKAQTELRAISNYNLVLKQKLLQCAKKEVVKQEKRKKLEVIDAEILRLSQSPKELFLKLKRNKAKNLLKNRQILIDELDKEESS